MVLCWDLSCSVGLFLPDRWFSRYVSRENNRMFYALLIAISVQSVGVFALIQAGLLTYEAGAFPVAWYCYRWVYLWAGNCSGRVDVPPGPGIARVRD